MDVFLPGTCVTPFDISLDKGPYGGPPILPLYLFQGCMDSWMARGQVIMALLDYLLPECVVWWYIDSAFMVNQAILFLPFHEAIEKSLGS